MSTQIIFVSGEAKWARVYEDQLDTKFGANRHITVAPDEASAIVMKSAGVRLQPKEEDGKKWYKFRRDHEKVFRDKTEVLGPPKVIDAEGNAFDKRIGNGSKVTLKLSVYDTTKGKGTRLEAVRVDEHVPYEDGDAGAANYPF